MNYARTSNNFPINVDFLPPDVIPFTGKIGMTYAPGKSHQGMHVLWDRNLYHDLDRLRYFYHTDILVYLIEHHEFHTVQIERNRKEARMNVDSISAGNPEDLYAYRPFIFTSNLTIGASVSYRDGFVGCFRGLQVNGKNIDLVSLARRAVYGVSEGCVGKCASNPCLNGGTCIEKYSSFYG